MLDSLKDIVKHTAGLGFIEMVKLKGTNTELKIETKDSDNTVVIYGSLYQPVSGIESTIGLSRLQILKGYIGMHDKSVISILTETRDNVQIPTEIVFDNKDGLVSNYRFMSESMINEQVKIPAFLGATWDVTFTPSKASISMLGENFGILGGFEKKFIANVDGSGTLKFDIGSGPTDRTSVPFAKNVNGTLSRKWAYPLSQAISILKLTDTASSSTMSFSDQGALKIEIDSGIGKYTYILPASKA